MLVSYTWSHALDNVDPDIPGQNPNDPNFTGRVEYGNAIFDQRHRFVWSGVYVMPWSVSFGWVATLASGLPYNWVTGANNSGDTGATTDRPVINGVVVARNFGRGGSIYDISPFLERPFAILGERFHWSLRESKPSTSSTTPISSATAAPMATAPLPAPVSALP